MNPLILMGAIVLVPTVLIIILRAKAALVFMSLCVGSVLGLLVGKTALDMVQTFVRGYNTTTQSIVQLGLLLVPVLLTLLFLSRTLAKSQMLINIFPALLTGVTTLFLAVPLLPTDTMNSIYDSNVWQQIFPYQAIIISVAALAALAQLWSSGHKLKQKDKKKH